MNFDAALRIIRKKYPNDLIRTCFFYKNLYVFAISFGKTFVWDDPTVFYIGVDSKTGRCKIYDFWDELLSNSDPEFDNAIKQMEYIDIPEEK